MRVPHTRTLTLLLALGGVACSGTKKATEVPASLALDPTSLAFKTVAVGEGVELPISLHAQTASPVSVLEMKVTDPGDGSAAAFGLAAPPQVVSGNDTATVTVRFAPTAVRNYAATLVITSNDADHPTQQVALTGSGATRAISISLEDPVGASAVLGDGGASIAFVDPPGGASGIAWPQVLISNTGGIAANLTGFRFLHGDAGFFLPTVPVLPQAVAPEQTRALEVAFAAPAGNTATQLVDALTLTFDDPVLPEATIALSATVTPNLPPVACAVVVSAQELDGTIVRATSGPVAIEPGALVGLSAFGEEAGDAGSPACSFDPESGRSGLGFSWSVAAAPAGSTAAFSTPTDPRPTFVPDVPGEYRLQLRVQDAQGASGRAELSFTAAPLEDLTVKLSWPGQPQLDLDLHLVRPGGVPFQAADDVSSLTADAGHDWGTPADPTDNPHFSGDDVGDGQLSESVWIDRPQDGCLGDGGCAYGVWVHEFQDRRAPTGARCGQTACFEGSACGCTGAGEVCEPGPTGASCATGAAPRIEVFLKGQIAAALSIPLSPATVTLPGPCFTWHALEIAIQPDGGVGAMVQPGDGGDVQYWGSHADTQRECEAGVGGYAPTSPPLLP